ncbi:MAG TPA: FHA domain-containing protein, partial [Steroidobacteraceae bacterium]|nr:FHA domain-containing protein [Steroidobacteraceae bacterium]
PELGLLAGIARAARIPVAGYVDLAVAACASLDACETVLHLDLQLHQAVLTELRGTETLRRCRVESAPRAGLRAVQAAWAQLVSEAMVRRTRFDPLHQATTEQQLYDRLPAWLSRLADADPVDVELEADAGKFAVSLRREQFVFAVEAYYAQLADLIRSARRAGEPVTIALSSRAASLPQLAERCLGLGEAQVVGLAEGAAALGGLAQAAGLATDEGEALVTALPRTTAPRRPAPAPRGATGRRPTHVTFAGRAHAISDEPLVLGLAPAEGRSLALTGSAAGVSRSHCTLVRENGVVRVLDHSRYGSFVNGVRVSGSAELAAGDRLRVGTPGVVLELVAVD